MKDENTTKIIFCVAEGDRGKWNALCLDFDIAVQGNSFQEVYDSLNSAIVDYLETVHTYPENEREAFLNRKAPRHIWFKYLFMAIASFIIKPRSAQKSIHSFTERVPCAA